MQPQNQLITILSNATFQLSGGKLLRKPRKGIEALENNGVFTERFLRESAPTSAPVVLGNEGHLAKEVALHYGVIRIKPLDTVAWRRTQRVYTSAGILTSKAERQEAQAALQVLGIIPFAREVP